jgi:hypothetical protein
MAVCGRLRKLLVGHNCGIRGPVVMSFDVVFFLPETASLFLFKGDGNLAQLLLEEGDCLALV